MRPVKFAFGPAGSLPRVYRLLARAFYVIAPHVTGPFTLRSLPSSFFNNTPIHT
jgi:hypothetical protein